MQFKREFQTDRPSYDQILPDNNLYISLQQSLRFLEFLVVKAMLLSLTAIEVSCGSTAPPKTSPVSRLMTTPSVMVSFAFSICPAKLSFLFMKISIFCLLFLRLQFHSPIISPIGASRQFQCSSLIALTIIGLTYTKGLITSSNYRMHSLILVLLLEQSSSFIQAKAQLNKTPNSLVQTISSSDILTQTPILKRWFCKYLSTS